MVRKHHSKKTHRRRHTRRVRHTRKRGGYRGAEGAAYTSGASQVLKQLAPASFSGGARRLKNAFKSIKELVMF